MQHQQISADSVGNPSEFQQQDTNGSSTAAVGFPGGFSSDNVGGRQQHSWNMQQDTNGSSTAAVGFPGGFSSNNVGGGQQHSWNMQQDTNGSSTTAVGFPGGFSSDNVGGGQQHSWNMVNTSENRLSGDANIAYKNPVTREEMNIGGWVFGESSSGGNARNQIATTLIFSSNQASPDLQPSYFPPNYNLNIVYPGSYSGPDLVMGSNVFPNYFELDRSNINQIPHGAGFPSVGNFLTVGGDAGADSSSDARGLPCKRKAPDGHSGQLRIDGNGNTTAPLNAEHLQHNVWAHQSVAVSSMTSYQTENSLAVNHPFYLNPQYGVGMRPNIHLSGIPMRTILAQQGATHATENFSRRVPGFQIRPHVPLNVIPVPGVQQTVNPFLTNVASTSRVGGWSQFMAGERNINLQQEVFPSNVPRMLPVPPAQIPPASNVGPEDVALRGDLEWTERRNTILSEIRIALALLHNDGLLNLEDLGMMHSFVSGVLDMYDARLHLLSDDDDEELRLLEEELDNVFSSLDEETILKHLKHGEYKSVSESACLEKESCCICQEEFVEREVVGILDCSHNFHSGCIKNWLMRKNKCPICRQTGLTVVDDN